MFVCMYVQGVQKKMCFSLSTGTHRSPTYQLPEIFKTLNATREYSRSYWLAKLANFYTTNSSPVLAGERWQINENSWKKHNFS